MFRKSLILLSLMLAVSAHAVDNDFGRTDAKEKNLSAAEMRDRFELGGEIYLADANGRLLYQHGETRSWRFGSKGSIESNWSFSNPGMKEIALSHVWTITDDGKILVHIRQYDSMERINGGSDVKTGKLLREEKIEVKDFAPVNWATKQDGGTVIVRLTPKLLEREEPSEISGLALSLEKPVVYDNKGRLWAAGGGMEGTFLYMRTYQGQFAVSFKPFKGAKEIGTVRGNEIVLKGDGDLKLSIRSLNPILAGNRPAKIYGVVDTTKKTAGLNSVRSGSSDTEKSFISHLD